MNSLISFNLACKNFFVSDTEIFYSEKIKIKTFYILLNILQFFVMFNLYNTTLLLY